MRGEDDGRELGVVSYADCIQIGARNMQNFSLLRAGGACREAGPAQARDVGDDQRAAAGREYLLARAIRT
jgi:hypothetical protein